MAFVAFLLVSAIGIQKAVAQQSVAAATLTAVPEAEGDFDFSVQEPVAPHPDIARLGTIPDWSVLDRYQKSITREEFTYLLNHCYARRESDYNGMIEIQFDRARIRKQSNFSAGGYYDLFFKPGAFAPPSENRYWRSAVEHEALPKNNNRPLEGIRIAVDPGHIGGIWHTWDDRNFKIGKDTIAVQEGRMTLKVAEILARDLSALGATVYLTRHELEPVTDLRVEDLREEARSYLIRKRKVPSSGMISQTAKVMFAISSEIRTRADLVNESMRPDLALCLHFNAAPWRGRIALNAPNHLHLLINGCYSDGEIKEDDTRLEMLLRLLQRVYYEEVGLADTLAKTMQRETGLPHMGYGGNSGKAVIDNKYVWARNLLANRMFMCPVIFFEPYCMNNKEVFARVQAGEYEGLREFGGKYKKNIYQEYADGVTAGLVRYFRQRR